MARMAPPDPRKMIIRNPVLLSVVFGCVSHPDGVACAEFADGETQARFHLAGYAMEMIREPEHRCGACNRADGRCEYASEQMVKHMLDAGYTMEQVHNNGKRALQPSIDAQRASQQ